jgi:hypothetical protein
MPSSVRSNFLSFFLFWFYCFPCSFMKFLLRFFSFVSPFLYLLCFFIRSHAYGIGALSCGSSRNVCLSNPITQPVVYNIEIVVILRIVWLQISVIIARLEQCKFTAHCTTQLFDLVWWTRRISKPWAQGWSLGRRTRNRKKPQRMVPNDIHKSDERKPGISN